MELGSVQDLLRKWRHIAFTETSSPGTHARVMAKVEEILRTGRNSTAGSYTEMQALIRERPGR
jgi:diacylglycerol kinase family enzyme